MSAPFSVSVNFGPMFFAVVFDTLLYGVLCTHMFLYFTSFQRDPLWMRSLVGACLVVETVHTTLNIISIYIPLVQNFGDYFGLLHASWAAQGTPITTGVVAMLVQWFFAWRIKIITRSMWIFAAIIFFSLVQISGAVGATISVHKIPYSLDFYKFQNVIIVWCIGAVTADVLITTTLVYFLSKRKSGMETTDTLVDKIIRLTVETNLLTFIWNIVDLALYLRITTTLHLVFNLTISKFYSLSLLVSLNARDVWKRDVSSQSGPHSLHVARGTIGGTEPNAQRGFAVGMLRTTESTSTMRGAGTKSQPIFIGVEAHELVTVDDGRTTRFVVGNRDEDQKGTLSGTRRSVSSSSGDQAV
ncbi:uncharacterized protein BXZ73DRAFT_107475 [Epithele typhae]|uniref:uncharacterized protein n=1 Tax=Epithele typhae TaxID=378194 RepID=UPI00200726A2|nr:uncharacterized protein BXZ73DRAFT_107475 [Epithele typhae]KAH9912339.1 hypothetical protein BXZ73DRAFT_107475 [Epithele typhae]